MGLFKPDLIRSFAVGFALGAVGLFLAMGSGADDVGNSVVPHAVAAPAVSADQGGDMTGDRTDDRASQP